MALGRIGGAKGGRLVLLTSCMIFEDIAICCLKLVPLSIIS